LTEDDRYAYKEKDRTADYQNEWYDMQGEHDIEGEYGNSNCGGKDNH